MPIFSVSILGFGFVGAFTTETEARAQMRAWPYLKYLLLEWKEDILISDATPVPTHCYAVPSTDPMYLCVVTCDKGKAQRHRDIYADFGMSFEDDDVDYWKQPFGKIIECALGTLFKLNAASEHIAGGELAESACTPRPIVTEV